MNIDLLNTIINVASFNEVITYILLLPIIATVIVFSHQVIGFKTSGIYVPLLMALSFLFIGIKLGLAVFAAALVVGTAARLLVQKIRMLALPRVAIVLSIVSFASLVLFFNKAVFYYSVWPKNINISHSILPILTIIGLTEVFMTFQVEKRWRSSTISILQNLVAAIGGYYIANWSLIQNTVIQFPITTIIIVIIINILIGKWAGLRLSEYWRFRKTIENVEIPDKK